MSTSLRIWTTTLLLTWMTNTACLATQSLDLWELAKAKQNIHRFSTLITAQQVRDHLGTDEGIEAAIDWCKKTAVTKVYIETFRSDYPAPRETLKRAKERFLAAGFDVSGCVTPTIVGKKSTGWNLISCYTDPKTQDHVREIFEYTAELFDEIMIDDFWFTDCQCSDCDTARRSRTVMLGLAGASIPESMQGRDLTPLLRDEQVSWREDWYYEHVYNTKPPRRAIVKCEGVRTNRWKYVRYPEIEPSFEQLYDLNGDQREEDNLASDPAHAQTLSRLRYRCDEYRRSLK